MPRSPEGSSSGAFPRGHFYSFLPLPMRGYCSGLPLSTTRPPKSILQAWERQRLHALPPFWKRWSSHPGVCPFALHRQGENQLGNEQRNSSGQGRQGSGVTVPFPAVPAPARPGSARLPATTAAAAPSSFPPWYFNRRRARAQSPRGNPTKLCKKLRGQTRHHFNPTDRGRAGAVGTSIAASKGCR